MSDSEDVPWHYASGIYTIYDPEAKTYINRYRTQNDIVASTIMGSGAEGVGKIEIAKVVGMNGVSHTGNRRISVPIQKIVDAFPDHIGTFQKAEGKVRMKKYYNKLVTDNPSIFVEKLERLEKLIGMPFPYEVGERIRFPDTTLSTLRITDVTLDRFCTILEMLQEEGVIVLLSRIQRRVFEKEQAGGYNFLVDRKSLMKCCIALEKKHFCRLLSMNYTIPPEDYGEDAEVEEKQVHKIIIVAPPDIMSVEDERVHAAILKIRDQFRADQKLFPHGQVCYAEKRREERRRREEKEAIRAAKKALKEKGEEEIVDEKMGQMTVRNYMQSFLPKDIELMRKRKKEIPLISQETLNSLSTTIRRPYGVRASLTATDSKLRKANKRPAQRRPMGEPSRKKKAAPVAPASKTSTGRSPRIKKKYEDDLDQQNRERNAMTRQRFTSREHDMLVFLRGVSYFLNPVHRFWLNPRLMRDIMHEFIPESRGKTISCLMAAGTREMLRPGRMAQLRFVVETLSKYPEMVEKRNQVAAQNFEDDTAKDAFFYNVFQIAHHLIFSDKSALPPIRTSDAEFRKFAQSHGLALQRPYKEKGVGLPRRSQKPKNVDDIQHCAAFNLIFSTMISDICDQKMPDSQNEVASELLVMNATSAAALTRALEVGRSEGLITRLRLAKQLNSDGTKPKRRRGKSAARASLSVFYRHFFSHYYRSDIIDLVNEYLNLTPEERLSCGEENPAKLLRFLRALYDDDVIDMEVGNLDEIVRYSLEATSIETDAEEKKFTKQLRFLENAPMALEKIGLQLQNDVKIEPPQKDDLESIVAPTFPVAELDPAKVKTELTRRLKGKKGLTYDIADKVLSVIRNSTYTGASVDELLEKTELPKELLQTLLDNFVEMLLAFPVGVDVRRYVADEYSKPWLTSNNDIRFQIRPWTLANGSINWAALRWMSEGVLMSSYYKPGILVEDLYSVFGFVLSPVQTGEILEMLEKIGAIELKTTVKEEKTFVSAFDEETKIVNQTYVNPNLDCIERFALLFRDVLSTDEMFKTFDSEVRRRHSTAKVEQQDDADGTELSADEEVQTIDD